jgi:transposase-like protein
MGMVKEASFDWPICQTTEETLLPIIIEHCQRGSEIHTDGWATYNLLEENGFVHRNVIHERNFVDPETGAHTQTIESNWRALKHRLKHLLTYSYFLNKIQKLKNLYLYFFVIN